MSSSESEDENFIPTELSEDEYLAKLKEFLSKFLKKIIFNDDTPKRIKKLLNDHNMVNYWIPAFTHPTYSSNNYEKIEALGDKVLDMVVVEFFLRKYPVLINNELFLTEIKNINTNNKFIADVTVKYELDKFIRIYVNSNNYEKAPEHIPYEIKADVFESIIAALYLSGNKIDEGLGLFYVKKWLFDFYGKIKIDKDRAYGSYKTQVEQYFKYFPVIKGELLISIEKFQGEHRGTISITPKVVKFFENQGGYDLSSENVSRSNMVIAEASAVTKDEVDEILFKKAYNFFKERGITTNTVESIRNINIFIRKDFAPYLEDLKKANKIHKFETVIFKKYQKLKGRKDAFTLSLVGVKKDGSRHPIFTIRKEHDPQENRKEIYNKVQVLLVKKYVESTLEKHDSDSKNSDTESSDTETPSKKKKPETPSKKKKPETPSKKKKPEKITRVSKNSTPKGKSKKTSDKKK